MSTPQKLFNMFVIERLETDHVTYYLKTMVSTQWNMLKQLTSQMVPILLKACVCCFLSNFYFSTNSCKSIHDIINYSTSIYPFELGKCGKEGKTPLKFEYLENEKSFLDEIKNIFHSF